MKLIAVAVAGAVAPTLVLAQNSVTISGRLNSTFESIKATGSTLGSVNDFVSRNRMTENSSEVRFSGREDLGGGLNAWFTIGTGLEPTFAGSSDAYGRGLIGSRNSGVGLDNKAWGSIMFGKWDVHYEAGFVPPLGNIDFNYIEQGLATFNSLIYGGGQVGVGNQGGRLNNVLRYVGPQWNVGSGRLQIIGVYARNDENTYNNNGVAAITGSDRPRQWQFAPQYQNGPFSVFYSYFLDKGSATATTAGANGAGALLGSVTSGTPTAATVGLNSGLRDLRGDRLGTSWTFDHGLKVGVIYDRFKSEIYNGVLSTSGSFSANLKRDVWSIPASYVTGQHKVSFAYGRANDLQGTRSGLATGYDASETGASFITLGYRYSLSKRTSLYTDWAKISNKRRAGYDFFAYAGAAAASTNNVSAGGPANLPGNSIGADPQTVQLGIYHVF
jgi:predicted porin